MKDGRGGVQVAPGFTIEHLEAASPHATCDYLTVKRHTPQRGAEFGKCGVRAESIYLYKSDAPKNRKIELKLKRCIKHTPEVTYAPEVSDG